MHANTFVEVDTHIEEECWRIIGSHPHLNDTIPRRFETFLYEICLNVYCSENLWPSKDSLSVIRDKKENRDTRNFKGMLYDLNTFREFFRKLPS